MDMDIVKQYTKIYIELLSYETAGSKQFQLEKLEKLDTANTLSSYLYAINKGNRFDYLNFLYKNDVITEQECADTIYSIWTMQERFYNCGIAKTKMIKFMKLAKKTLVLPDAINELSGEDMLTVYRGAKYNDYKGLSWTIEKQVAIWFASRFSKNSDKCYIFTGKLPKRDIIAYFNGRKEAEIVCDYRKIKEIECEEMLMEKRDNGIVLEHNFCSRKEQIRRTLGDMGWEFVKE